MQYVSGINPDVTSEQLMVFHLLEGGPNGKYGGKGYGFLDGSLHVEAGLVLKHG